MKMMVAIIKFRVVKKVSKSLYCIIQFFKYAQVAQLVEQRTENPCVGGSNPPRATTYAAVAQLVRAPGCGPGGR